MTAVTRHYTMDPDARWELELREGDRFSAIKSSNTIVKGLLVWPGWLGRLATTRATR
jgi:hypothetical protein